ncbi:magnesium chelatase [Niastella koreensis]|uniref:ATPase associated with various cellular activities AAA_3 n=2 Tax=Niastella koreensis TaxID=354356 RepID=G8TEF1_NIAKG|nr:MoxR family ATPase [Niastella koreensis]AEV98361.1 ATPase associated with various cellular activities AAA_3 [Niastella koreensis GR20-10]OQP53185.1 magnesium chelatase [Niastella koreensis]
MENFFDVRTDLSALQQSVQTLKQEIGKVIVGQEQMVELLLAAVLADGHVLIEGVPGVAKTLTAKLLSKSISVGFSRIQFTPDMMPSDVIGTTIFNPKDSTFQFNKGPIFSNIVLIDEINRAPAKTQAALFEVMEERQITVDGHSYQLSVPFMVVATQNPIEQEGTYHLPEAQLDRFLFKINVSYPSAEQEFRIVLQHHQQNLNEMINQVSTVLSATQVSELRKQVRSIHVEEKLINFITTIVANTRNHKSIYLGASPRASIGILNGAKALASMRGRDFVTPDDIIYVIPPVLRHRIVLTPEKEMEGASTDDVIQQIVASIEVPR